jgi:hypothetical protein
MKFCVPLLLSFFLAFFSLSASGQMCGKFKVIVSVQDAEGKPIDNGVIQFLPITKDETLGKQFVRDKTDLSTFSVQFTEGESVTAFHKLIVSADGYQTTENEIKFYSCLGPRITVKLSKKDSIAAPVWEFANSIMIETKDSGGKALSGTKIIIKKEGKIVGTKEAEYYGLGFSLPNGEYVFRIEKEGYDPQEIKVDMTKIADVNVTTSLKPKK